MFARPVLTLGAFAALCPVPVVAAPLTAGDILFTVGEFNPTRLDNRVFELTPAGSVRQPITVPLFPNLPLSRPLFRDVAALSDGRVAIFDGTLNPALTVVDPTTRAVQQLTLSGWNTTPQPPGVFGSGGGGLAAFGTTAFVTDMAATGPADPNGLIRFDTLTGAGTRFATGRDFLDVAAGGDGLLYGLYLDPSGGRGVAVYDPNSLQLRRDLTLTGPDVYALAVNANGELFVGTAAGITRLSADGRPLASVSLPTSPYPPEFSSVIGLDLDGRGNVVALDTYFRVYHTTESFTSPTFLVSFGGEDGNVAYVPFRSTAAVPEPSIVLLFGLSVAAAGVRLRLRKANRRVV